MRSKLLPSLFFLILFFGFLGTPSSKADIIFPARLELREIKPGIYQLMFVLPVQEGKVIKAQPILPENSEVLTDPEVSGDENFKIISFQVSIPVGSLSGQKIGIDGLSGTQVDILLKVETLDGRIYQTTLSPVNAYYIIPYPPTIWEMVKTAGLEGLRTPISVPGLLFTLLLISPFFQRKQWLGLGLAFLLSHALGRVLANQQYLLIPTYLPGLSTWIMCFLLAFWTVLKKEMKFSMISGVLFSVLLGLSFGAAGKFEPVLNSAGLNVQELITEGLILNLGVAFGLFLAYSLARECRFVCSILFRKEYFIYPISRIVAVISLGYIGYELSLFWSLPSMLPQIPFTVLLTIIGIALWVYRSEESTKKSNSLTFLTRLLMGIALGLIGGRTEFTLPFILSATLIIAVLLFFQKSLSTMLSFALVTLSALSAGWYLAQFAMDSLSYAIAQTLGFGVILTMIFLFLSFLKANPILTLKGKSSKLIPTLLLVGILIAWIPVFIEDIWPKFTNEFTIGQLAIPALTIILILIAIFSWPRYRAIHKDLKLQKRTPELSLILLGIAFFVLPFTLSFANPWYKPTAPEETEARQILNQVLDQTYRAFNLEDEEELFVQLSESVDQDLIDDVYLDSRRRLNVGLREGSEVLVQEVDVAEIGARSGGTQAEEGFEYPAEWTVTARVKHLQHIHYRQNRYIGTVRVRIEDGKWKIANIVLTSEDRTIIAGTNL